MGGSEEDEWIMWDNYLVNLASFGSRADLRDIGKPSWKPLGLPHLPVEEPCESVVLDSGVVGLESARLIVVRPAETALGGCHCIL
jgi:hypothetical protein